MKIKPATIKELNITWWMARKPYVKHSRYDVFYLDICRNVFEVIDNVTQDHRDIRTTPDRGFMMDLAYTATAYFEDRVNGFGFWTACSDIIRERIGTSVPFHSEAEYLAAAGQELNPKDLELLFFTALLQTGSGPENIPTVYPYEDPYIKALVGEIFAYFETIDEIEETDFYRKWLDLRTLGFIEMKARVLWLALSGYVFCRYFTSRVGDDMELVAQRFSGKEFDSSAMGIALYAAQDQRSFGTPSGLLAIYPVDVLARVAQVTEEQRRELEAMKCRPYGRFRVSEHGDNYSFRHTLTGDTFIVDASTLPQRLPLAEVDLYHCTLARWGQFWNISGACMGVSRQDADRADAQRQTRFCAYSPAYREQIFSIAARQHAKALGFFGEPFIAFPDREALQERLDAFVAWQHGSDGNPVPNMNVVAQLPPKRRVAIFLPTENTAEIGDGYALINDLLSRGDVECLSPDERMYLEEALADDTVSVDFWRLMYQRHGGTMLKTIAAVPAFSDSDFDALMRLYRPADYAADKLPRLSVTDMGKDGAAGV